MAACSSTSNSILNPFTGPERVINVGSGTAYSCALTSLGHVYCWGFNADGELGNRGVADTSLPVSITDSATNHFIELSVGDNHACALTTGGTPVCWGSNDFGQLGTGVSATAIPAAVPGAPALTRVRTSAGSTCGLAKSDGALWCWGALLLPVASNIAVPTRIATPVKFSDVRPGGSFIVRDRHRPAGVLLGHG